MSDTPTNQTPALGDLVERRAVAPGSPVALIIEDDPDGLRIAGAMLAHLGYAIRAASTPDQAIHLLMDDAPDLLLVDVCLPMMDGISLIKLVRRMRDLSGVPLVAASGIYDANGDVRHALAQLGVYAFLGKPYTVASLREAVDFAKSAALKQAPPRPGTMKPGGLWENEASDDHDERTEREARGRQRSAPKALPASPEFKAQADLEWAQKEKDTDSTSNK
jgi:CheY-like chemotaxis protein